MTITLNGTTGITTPSDVTITSSGGGNFVIQPPNSATDRTLTLPDSAGTVDTLQRAGNVLQVVSATTTLSTTTSSTSYVAVDGLTASITPISVSSKVLVFVNSTIYTSAANVEAALTIYRSGSDLSTGAGFTDAYQGGNDLIVPMSMMYLDSPASAASVTYAVYFKRTQGASSIVVNNRNVISSIILMEIAA
jgi:hypothetical protein